MDFFEADQFLEQICDLILRQLKLVEYFRRWGAEPLD